MTKWQLIKIDPASYKYSKEKITKTSFLIIDIWAPNLEYLREQTYIFTLVSRYMLKPSLGSSQKI